MLHPPSDSFYYSFRAFPEFGIKLHQLGYCSNLTEEGSLNLCFEENGEIFKGDTKSGLLSDFYPVPIVTLLKGSSLL